MGGGEAEANPLPRPQRRARKRLPSNSGRGSETGMSRIHLKTTQPFTYYCWMQTFSCVSPRRVLYAETSMGPYIESLKKLSYHPLPTQGRHVLLGQGLIFFMSNVLGSRPKTSGINEQYRNSDKVCLGPGSGRRGLRWSRGMVFLGVFLKDLWCCTVRGAAPPSRGSESSTSLLRFKMDALSTMPVFVIRSDVRCAPLRERCSPPGRATPQILQEHSYEDSPA